MDAERAYLFRHALLRDAAYELHLPGSRARLHEIAVEAIERLCGGGADTAPPVETAASGHEPVRATRPHATDPYASELSAHAAQAGLSVKARSYARRAAEVAEARFQYLEASRLWLIYADASPRRERPHAFLRATMASHRAGALDPAVRVCATAVAGFRRSGERRLEVVALANRAELFRQLGRPVECEKTVGLAFRRLGDDAEPWIRGILQSALAGAFYVTGRAQAAEKLLRDSLQLHRRAGPSLELGHCIGNLALLAKDAGRLEEAERMYDEAIVLLRRAGNRRSEAIALFNYANLLSERRRLSEAEGIFRESLDIARGTSDLRTEGMVLGNLGNVLSELGRLAEADRALARAILLHRECGNRRFEGVHLCDRGVVRIRQGETLEAGRIWSEGIAILRALGDSENVRLRRERMREACSGGNVPELDPGLAV